MDEDLLLRLRKLQSRVDESLTESPEDFEQSGFSEYLAVDNWKLSDRFQAIAEDRDVEGLEAAMDEFDRLAATDDKVGLQHALMVFLVSNRVFSRYGLKIPSLQERSAWKTRPSKRNETSDKN